MVREVDLFGQRVVDDLAVGGDVALVAVLDTLHHVDHVLADEGRDDLGSGVGHVLHVGDVVGGDLVLQVGVGTVRGQHGAQLVGVLDLVDATAQGQ